MIVPSLRPDLLASVVAGAPDVEVVGSAPWHFAIKFLGSGTLRAAAGTDCVVLTDNQFHDGDLVNPLKNNLMSLTAVLAVARRRRVPTAYYCGGVGPVRSPLARSLVRFIATRLDVLTVRDRLSLDTLTAVAPDTRPSLAADVVFTRSTAGRESAARAPRADSARYLGVNLSSVFWGRRRPGHRTPAGTLDVPGLAAELRAAAETQGLEPIFIVTHSADVAGLTELRKLLGAPASSLRSLDAHGFQGAFDELCRSLRCVLSDRYHELTLFAAAGVPVVGVGRGDKVVHLLETLDLPELVLSGNPGGPTANDLISAAWAARGRLVAKAEFLGGKARSATDTLFELVRHRRQTGDRA